MGGAEEQPAVVKQETPEPKSQQVKDQEGPPATHTQERVSVDMSSPPPFFRCSVFSPWPGVPRNG